MCLANNTYSKYSFIDIFLPVYMLLAPYSIFGISEIPLYILFLYSIISIFFKKGGGRLYIYKYLLYFLLGYTLISLASIYRRTHSIQFVDIKFFLMPWVQFFIISVTFIDIHKERLFAVYSKIGMVCMITMYIQAIGLLIFKMPAIPIRLLPVQAGDAHFWGYFKGERPSTFFPEPQAYASFMIPLLIIALYKRKYIFSIFIAFSILLSTSSQGILLVGIIFLIFILYVGKWHNKILFLSLFGLLTIGLFTFPIFQTASEKILKTNYLEDNIRLTRGFIIYSTFNQTDLIWGIGDGQQQQYVEKYLSFMPWIERYNDDQRALLGYSTTFARILISTGIIPLILFIILLCHMARHDDKVLFTFLVVIIASSFASTLLFNAWFLFYYLLYFGCMNKDRVFEEFYKLKFC